VPQGQGGTWTIVVTRNRPRPTDQYAITIVKNANAVLPHALAELDYTFDKDGDTLCVSDTLPFSPGATIRFNTTP